MAPAETAVTAMTHDSLYDLAALRRLYPGWRLVENEDDSLTAVRIGDQHTVTAQTAIGLMTKMDTASAKRDDPHA
jgi:hypothetical protein